MEKKYRRILLKLSGEVLGGEKGFGIDNIILNEICSVIASCSKSGCQIGIVVGGGNFWRGRSNKNMEKTKADNIGMLATVMNSIVLSDAFEQLGVSCKVMTAVNMPKFGELFVRDKAVEYLENGNIVVFGCGTGNPCFSTDSAAALRAVEISADIMFKATNVDGVYDKNPHEFSDAKLFEILTHDDLLEKKLNVIDASAAAICGENDMELLVFNLSDPENIKKAIQGEKIGTLVRP